MLPSPPRHDRMLNRPETLTPDDPERMMTLTEGPALRRKSVVVKVGKVVVGGNAPVVVQSMTNTDTADVDSTRFRDLEACLSSNNISIVT